MFQDEKKKENIVLKCDFVLANSIVAIADFKDGWQCHELHVSYSMSECPSAYRMPTVVIILQQNNVYRVWPVKGVV